MPLQALADHAGQVIAGRVISVRSFWAESPRRIESEVTFGDVEYFKGALSGQAPEFRLAVPGGAVGDVEMHIGCAPDFAVGQKWLLFVLPTYKTFPVVGLSQGAMRIVVAADGVERVYTPGGVAVTGVDEGGFVKVTEPTTATAHLHESLNARVHVDAQRAGAGQAVAWQDFLAQLRPVLSASKDHQMTEPAGRRVAVPYESVPLRLAPVQGSDAVAPRELRGRDAVRPIEAGPRNAKSKPEGAPE